MGNLKITMPAEWSPHTACLILYPHNPSTYRLDKVHHEVQQVARAIASTGNEMVILYCNGDNQQKKELQRVMSDLSNVRVEYCPSNDTWARDTAPTFVLEHLKESSTKLMGLDWDFNAYGGPEEGCYWPCNLDQEVATKICQNLASSHVVPHLTCQKISIILEGGSIHSDGEGTILTTEECLLNPNRNPNLSKSEIEQTVLSSLGASKMIWLEHGLAHDEDTNGHVDNWACFIKPGEVVLAWTDDQENDAINFERCRKAENTLKQCTDSKGRQFTVRKLYLPRPIFYSKEEAESLKPMLFNGKVIHPRAVGERLAGSYVNFYIANQAVVVPQFGDQVYDAKAVETLASLFPERQVVGVPSREILIGGGNIHCITQQVPASAL